MQNRDFYIPDCQPQQVKTATPTGLLADPLDLVNSTQPWITVTSQSTEQTLGKKKTLLFADPFYAKRQSASEIYSQLINHLKQLFSILVISPIDGKLEDWFGTEDALKSIPQYDDDTLFKAALSQRNLSREEVFLLHHWGVNILLNRPYYTIDSSIADADSLPDMTRHLSGNCHLSLENIDLNKFLSSGHFSLVKTKINTLSMLSQTIDTEEFIQKLAHNFSTKLEGVFFHDKNALIGKQFNTLLKSMPGLKRVGGGELLHWGESRSQLDPTLISQVESIQLILRTNQEDLLTILALPRLAELDIHVSLKHENDKDNVMSLANLPVGSLKHLKKLRIRSTYVQIPTLLNWTPALQYLEVSSDPNILHYCDTLLANSLPALTYIKINSQVHCSQLFKAAPNVEILDVEYVVDIFMPLQANSLLKLTTVYLRSMEVTKEDIVSLLKAASQLQHLYFDKNCVNANREAAADAFIEFAPNSLKLTEVSLFDPTTTQLAALARAASNLQILRLYGDIRWHALSEKFEPATFPQLRIVEFGGDAPIFLPQITSVLNAAPNVETLFLDVCSYQDLIVLIKLYPHLKHITITKPVEINRSNEIDHLVKLKEERRITVVSPDLYRQLQRHTSHADSVSTDVHQNYLDMRSKEDVTISCRRYYTEKNPREYRLYPVRPKLDTLEPPKPYVPDDFKPIPVEEKNDLLDHDEFDCVFPATATKENNNTVFLPGLIGEKKICALRVVDQSGKEVPLEKLILWHSSSTHFHRLTFPTSGKYRVCFTSVVAKKQPALLPELRALEVRYQKHEPNQAFLDPRQVGSLRDVVQYVDDNHTGHCEHRAIAAYEKLTDQFKHNASIFITYNEIHAFLEVHMDGEQYALELGGYEVGKVNEIEVLKPVELPPTAQLPASAIPECSFAEVLRDNKTALVTLQTDTDYEHFHLTLKSTYPAIFIARKLEDLNVTGYGMTKDGNVKPHHTAFRRWLKTHRQGAIIVDMRRLQEGEMAQLNDLLDGKIEGHLRAKELRIFLLDKPGREYGPDFCWRVKKRTRVDSKNVVLLPKWSAPSESKPLEIDLFNSLHWQRHLVGIWQLVKKPETTALSFQWNKGVLLDHLPKNIVFKNPPLHDHHFTSFIAELKSLRRFTWIDQVKTLPAQVALYEHPNKGYDWQHLSQSVSFSLLAAKTTVPYVLSDSTLLFFIQDPCYEFSEEPHQLETRLSYLKRGSQIEVVCSPDLSAEALAQFLTAAKEEKVSVRFLTHGLDTLQMHHPLRRLTVKAEEEKIAVSHGNVEWQLHQDVYFAAQQFLSTHPDASCFSLTSLDENELGWVAALSEQGRMDLLMKSELALQAKLSDILINLRNGKCVVLTGNVPKSASKSLYTALTKLSLGYIEGKRFDGKLLILTPPDEADLAYMLTGKKLVTHTCSMAEKMALFDQLHASKRISINRVVDDRDNFATFECKILQDAMRTFAEPSSALSDEERAAEFDRIRLQRVQQVLAISPWAMLCGPTGIGKTHFVHAQLPADKTFFTIEEWLAAKVHPATLVIDEANFAIEGQELVERFRSLKAGSPRFLWRGKEYLLSPQDNVLFAFNPAQYSKDRSDKNLLGEHFMPVKFERLPDYYLRARIITPLLKKYAVSQENSMAISEPLLAVYQWIIEHSENDEELITPRELKAMVNLVMTKVLTGKIHDAKVLRSIATQIAYQIGKQTLSEKIKCLPAFETEFKPKEMVTTHPQLPNTFLDYQRNEYDLIQNILLARKNLLSAEQTDLGLGGVILEGSSQIGKTHFIEQVVAELKEDVCFISPQTPYSEKARLLTDAFNNGKIVVAHEFNTSQLWPNKLLNFFCMGQDEHGKPAKKPGFLLLATQNPIYYAKRYKQDPALRRRLIKLTPDWPVYVSLTKNDGLMLLPKKPEQQPKSETLRQQPSL